VQDQTGYGNFITDSPSTKEAKISGKYDEYGADAASTKTDKGPKT
jgi:hypothetical protein